MTIHDVILLVVFVGALGAGLLLGALLRGRTERKHREAAVQAALDLERQAAERSAREAAQHRANRLRDNGRVTDVHPDASGPPSRVARMRVLGMQPDGRDRPPTRM